MFIARPHMQHHLACYLKRDSHKAAYVPACIAGTNTDRIITSEPAVVIPSPTDVDFGMPSLASSNGALPAAATVSVVPSASVSTGAAPTDIPSGIRPIGVEKQPSAVKTQQAGAVMRRNSVVINPALVVQKQQLKSVGSVATTEQTTSSSSGRKLSAYMPSSRLAKQEAKRD